MDKIDVINSTLGKALGGASGGYTTGRRDVVEILRQKSRPYLFSNSIAPPIVGASLKVLDLLTTNTQLRDQLARNTKQFREGMKKAGFKIIGNDECPIAPVMLGDARLASEFADEMLKRGIYVIGFSYPVVPKGEARIRVQLSAVHTPEQIDRTINAFIEVGKAKGVI
jgi:glycine C-acetyltransferase